VFLILGCKSNISKNKEDEVLARVHNKYLYASDLEGVIPDGSGITDSISITHSYINNWIKNQLFIRKAETNLPDSLKNFRKQLENYRNSLLVYQYESNLVRQFLDTIVSDDEIQMYYEENNQNFQLRNNIIKVYFVILRLDTSVDEDPIKSYIFSDNSEDIDLLEDYCKDYAVDYYLEDQWIYFTDLQTTIPIETYSQISFLESNEYVELEDENFKYFVRIRDYKIKESVSPLSFVKDNIKSIIINKRKVELINKMHNDVYENALENNDFEIF
jgi:hypothetical protein